MSLWTQTTPRSRTLVLILAVLSMSTWCLVLGLWAWHRAIASELRQTSNQLSGYRARAVEASVELSQLRISVDRASRQLAWARVLADETFVANWIGQDRHFDIIDNKWTQVLLGCDLEHMPSSGVSMSVRTADWVVHTWSNSALLSGSDDLGIEAFSDDGSITTEYAHRFAAGIRARRTAHGEEYYELALNDFMNDKPPPWVRNFFERGLWKLTESSEGRERLRMLMEIGGTIVACFRAAGVIPS